jgi:hypothetical protein
MTDFKEKLDDLENDRKFLSFIDENIGGHSLLEDRSTSNFLETKTTEILSEGKAAVPFLIEKYNQVPLLEKGIYSFKAWLFEMLTQFKQADNFVVEEIEKLLDIRKEQGNNNDEIIRVALMGIYRRAKKNGSMKLYKRWWTYFQLYWEFYEERSTSVINYNDYYFSKMRSHADENIINVIKEDLSDNSPGWITTFLEELKKVFAEDRGHWGY